jgi:hypothetical protein
MNVNDFDCNALCDLGASIFVMPRKIYDMLGLPPLENCYFDVSLADVAKKKPLGRINDVLIMVNNNLVIVVLAAQLETPRERYDEHSGKFSLSMKPRFNQPVGERNHF